MGCEVIFHPSSCGRKDQELKGYGGVENYHMKIIQGQIGVSELEEMAKKMHGNLVKAMVDIEKEIISVDAPMHSDLLELLIQKEDSQPKNLWGINIHPDKTGEDFIEFDSMINLRPSQGNRSRGVENKETQTKIVEVVRKRLKP